MVQLAPPLALVTSWPGAATSPVVAVDGVPAAMQVAAAQATARRIPTPVGRVTGAQVAPPSVLRATAPAALPGVLGVDPTAMQRVGPGQARLAGTIPAGRSPSRVQLSPWSTLRAAHHAEPSVAKARQRSLAGQLSALRAIAPEGSWPSPQVRPPSSVTATAPAAPTARQFDLAGQDTPASTVSPAGGASLRQVAPPSKVASMATPVGLSPTAQQCLASAQASAVALVSEPGAG